VVATAGGIQDAWACNRTAQPTAQLGNVLEAAVGTRFWPETSWRRARVAMARREELVFFMNAILQPVRSVSGRRGEL